MYDLNLFPIKTVGGRNETKSAGFTAVSPPRRSARSRSNDLLLISLFLDGDETLSPDLQRSWLNEFSQIFFKTSGTVTAALRTFIEALNLTLMEQNLKLAKDGGGMRGTLNLAAIHSGSLYIAQTGYIHAYVLMKNGMKHFSDTSSSDRGLGFSRSPSIRYYQADLDAGGYLFLTDTPLNTWTEELLLGGAFPDLEQLKRRLLNQAPATFRLDLVQIKPGEGKIHVHEPQPKLDLVSEEPPGEIEAEVLPSESGKEETDSDLLDEAKSDTQQILAMPQQEVDQGVEEPSTAIGDEEILPEAVPEALVPTPTPDTSIEEIAPEEILPEAVPEALVPTPTPDTEIEEKAPQDAPVVDIEEEIEGEENIPPAEERPKKEKIAFRSKAKAFREDGLKGMGVFFDWWGQARGKVRGFFDDLMLRLSPETKGESLRLSKGTMLFIAIAVPILVVTIAVSVYLVRGRTLQYQDYMGQAMAASENAKSIGDPVVARDLWSQTLTFLDNAEEYKKTDEILELRQEAQTTLDLLDGAVRLAYQPAISDVLYSGINITRIISYGLDLYLFDETDGRIIHATRSQQGYVIDPEFVCSAGAFNTGTVGVLVDMVELPINNTYQAHILAVDVLGNVAYCGPGMDPVVQSLPEKGAGVGEGVRIDYEYNRLYVLNPAMGSVLIYGATEGQFLDPPDNYFEDARVEEVPDFSKIVDMAVNGPELYLLRGDGLMVDCVYSGLPDNPVTCEQPVTYIDGRAGSEDQALVMPDASYVSVLYTAPPDPSVSVLDATNADIYRFSLRFRAYQRLRPDLGEFEVEAPTATAFTIGIDQIAFIAFGSQVFYAYVD